jgi:hypothetical protein
VKLAKSKIQRLFLEKGASAALQNDVFETLNLWQARVRQHSDTCRAFRENTYRTKQGQDLDIQSETDKQLATIDAAQQSFIQKSLKIVADLDGEMVNALIARRGLNRTLDPVDQIKELLLAQDIRREAREAQEAARLDHKADVESKRRSGHAVSDQELIPPDVITKAYLAAIPAIVPKDNTLAAKQAAEAARMTIVALEAPPFPLISPAVIEKGDELMKKVVCPVQLAAREAAVIRAEALDIIFNETRGSLRNPLRVARPLEQRPFLSDQERASQVSEATA